MINTSCLLYACTFVHARTDFEKESGTKSTKMLYRNLYVYSKRSDMNVEKCETQYFNCHPVHP